MRFSNDILTDGILWYAVFLLSTTLHEASHSFVSYKSGDRTAYEGGQVTLNPIPHIKREKIGMVIVPIITFLTGGWMMGWASAPYNYEWAYRFPKKSALMAAAGPASNLFLAIAAIILIHIGISLNGFYVPESITFNSIVDPAETGFWQGAAKFLSILFSLNLILFVFNLFPLPPLDGSGVVKFFLSDESARKYMDFLSNPAFAIAGIIIAWKLFDFVYPALHLLVINLIYPGVTYS